MQTEKKLYTVECRGNKSGIFRYNLFWKKILHTFYVLSIHRYAEDRHKEKIRHINIYLMAYDTHIVQNIDHLFIGLQKPLCLDLSHIHSFKYLYSM